MTMLYLISWASLISSESIWKKLTRKEQILAELDRGAGTAKQLADRMGVKLTIVRSTLSGLHKQGLIRDTGKDAGAEGVWEVVK